MNKKKLYLDLEWSEALYESCKHLPYPEEIIRSVTNGDKLKAFEAKGGNEAIYYDIKETIDKYCYRIVEHCRKEREMIFATAKLETELKTQT